MANHAREILEKIRNGSLSEQERILVESWYLQTQRDQTSDHSPEDFAKTLEEIRERIPVEEHVAKQPNRQPWLYAAAILILVSGLNFLYRSTTNRKTPLVQTKTIHDVEAGTNKATLILSDGSTLQLGPQTESGKLPAEVESVILSKPGQLIYKSLHGGSTTPKTSSSAYNQITTPKGGQYKLVLSDGTQVWLNAASALRFPLHFGSNQRKVELSGEAYFEVAKNSVPFLVKTASQEIKVLGTHFDVNAYDDEKSTRTTLLEGSVQVRRLQPDIRKKTQTLLLKPGQQSRLDAGSLSVLPIDAEEEVAWKNGSMSFVNADIQSIMRQVSRWYNVEVVYSGNVPVRLFTGSISRKAKLSELLTILKLSKINFSLHGRQLTVSP